MLEKMGNASQGKMDMVSCAGAKADVLKPVATGGSLFF